MTVIAGASLFSGVILLADSRATIERCGRPDIRADVAQKIIPLTSTTVIGFSGNVHVAALILEMAIRQLSNRTHRNAVSLRLWLPRLLKHAYSTHAHKHGNPALSFLVGSVVPGYPNLVERAKVVPIFETIGFGRSPIKRNFVPDIVMRILMRSANDIFVPVGTCRNLLYSMHAPGFLPRDHAPLDYCAIGSGHRSTIEIAKTADWLLAGQPGNDLVEGLALTDAVSEFIAGEGIEDVGGMFPIAKVDGRGVGLLGHSMGLPGHRISIAFDDSLRRWVQRNEATGKQIELLLPWEIDPRRYTSDLRFDDWHDAVRAFNPLRLQKNSTE
jgi:hypothetical protein